MGNELTNSTIIFKGQMHLVDSTNLAKLNLKKNGYARTQRSLVREFEKDQHTVTNSSYNAV